MYTSLVVRENEEHLKIDISDFKDGDNIICPGCEKPTRARRGEINTHHFSHISLGECDLGSGRNNSMSEWHKAWQNKFPLKNREVRVTDSDGEWRVADVLIDKTVFEFQHSHYPTEEIKKRSEFYTNIGYKVVWVFDYTSRDIRVKYDCRYPIKDKWVKKTIGHCFGHGYSLLSDNVRLYLDIGTPSRQYKNKEKGGILIRVDECEERALFGLPIYHTIFTRKANQGDLVKPLLTVKRYKKHRYYLLVTMFGKYLADMVVKELNTKKLPASKVDYPYNLYSYREVNREVAWRLSNYEFI